MRERSETSLEQHKLSYMLLLSSVSFGTWRFEAPAPVASFGRHLVCFHSV
jgi:hypothetical protein